MVLPCVVAIARTRIDTANPPPMTHPLLGAGQRCQRIRLSSLAGTSTALITSPMPWPQPVTVFAGPQRKPMTSPNASARPAGWQSRDELVTARRLVRRRVGVLRLRLFSAPVRRWRWVGAGVHRRRGGMACRCSRGRGGQVAGGRGRGGNVAEQGGGWRKWAAAAEPPRRSGGAGAGVAVRCEWPDCRNGRGRVARGAGCGMVRGAAANEAGEAKAWPRGRLAAGGGPRVRSCRAGLGAAASAGRGLWSGRFFGLAPTAGFASVGLAWLGRAAGQRRSPAAAAGAAVAAAGPDCGRRGLRTGGPAGLRAAANRGPQDRPGARDGRGTGTGRSRPGSAVSAAVAANRAKPPSSIRDA